MIPTIKKLIKLGVKSILPSAGVDYFRRIRSLKRRFPSECYYSLLTKFKFVHPNQKLSLVDGYLEQAEKMFPRLQLDSSSFYVYPYDKMLIRQLPKGIINLASITPDYGMILDSNLHTISEILSKDNSIFSKRELKLIVLLQELEKRIKTTLEHQKSERSQILSSYFSGLLGQKPDSLDKAIQKLLFYNALLWQMWHWHNGLGRLDLILYEYYEKDIKNGKIDREQAKSLIKEMCITLGKDTNAKSMSLKGDTGQYILLGGIDSKDQTVQNELTEIFLEVFQEYQFPDPKLILRVNNNTSDTIWDKSIASILTGNGSPLLLNEDVVMKGMVDFGYKKEDVWNVGTSACWEPLIIGKSFDQNNSLENVPIIVSLNEFLSSSPPELSFRDFLESYKPLLRRQILSHIHDIQFDCSPLFSLFFDDCIKRNTDFTQGGAVYAYHGVQVVSFPNFINALLNIRDFVFENKIYSLQECKQAIETDFEGKEDMRLVLLSNSHRFGSTEPDVLALTNEMMAYISGIVSEIRVNGEKVKIGFSSSTYIEHARNIEASLDGRKAGEPFAVHISPVSHKIDIQEVIDFAGALDYNGNRLNGNVVDFILPSVYKKVPGKLRTILKTAVQKGIFELQLNVLDAATLKDAKANPEKYPNLIVRVWGFSAYFNDLPEEYKDNLIKRAETYA